MKVAIAFLLVALNCCFDKSAASVQQKCLTQLFQNDAQQFLKDLGNLLCKYKLAKEKQNQELFMAFLNGVNTLLEDVGCTVDDLLGIKVVPNLQNAEQIADSVAVILFDFLNGLFASVTNVLKNLPSLVTDVLDTLVPEVVAVLNILEHIDDVKNVTCDVLEEILPIVAEILKLGGEILNKVLSDLGIAENKRILPVAV